MVNNPSRTADKFDSRGVPCVFLGYPSNQKGYKFYNLLTKTTFVSRDAIFNEIVFPFADNSTKSYFSNHISLYPVNFKEAVADPGWCAAMDVELKALEENDTWELTILPAGKKAIGSHWIFKTKLKADGTEERKKARLHKYTKELLKEGGVLNNKPYKLPMEPNLKSQVDVDICYTVQLLSQFMQSPTSVHMQDVKHLLRYLLNTLRQEAEYRAMAMTCCKVTWLVNLFKDLGIKDMEPVELFCDNQVALYIADNPVFHARTKHIEVDCYYVRDRLNASKIKPTYVHTKSQLADVFTKVMLVDQHTKLLSKLGVSGSINSQLEGECTKEKG
nr:cysteine-rich RLK (receptor-like protein kinase) 8 [Tanacetum cinerariifolium]